MFVTDYIVTNHIAKDIMQIDIMQTMAGKGLKHRLLVIFYNLFGKFCAGLWNVNSHPIKLTV